MSDAALVEHLSQVRGVGQWTVEMLLIFRLGRLLSRLLQVRGDVLGDEMGGVAMAPSGHRDVCAGGAGGLR